MGGFGKEVCFSDESQYPYEGFCDALSHLCKGRGVLSDIPPLPQCMDRVIQYKLQFISTMTLEGHPCIDDIPLSYGMFFLNNFLEFFLEGQKPMYFLVFTNNIYKGTCQPLPSRRGPQWAILISTKSSSGIVQGEIRLVSMRVVETGCESGRWLPIKELSALTEKSLTLQSI